MPNADREQLHIYAFNFLTIKDNGFLCNTFYLNLNRSRSRGQQGQDPLNMLEIGNSWRGGWEVAFVTGNPFGLIYACTLLKSTGG